MLIRVRIRVSSNLYLTSKSAPRRFNSKKAEFSFFLGKWSVILESGFATQTIILVYTSIYQLPQHITFGIQSLLPSVSRQPQKYNFAIKIYFLTRNKSCLFELNRINWMLYRCCSSFRLTSNQFSCQSVLHYLYYTTIHYTILLVVSKSDDGKKTNELSVGSHI